VAKNPWAYRGEKRSRELAKQKKRLEKQQRRLNRSQPVADPKSEGVETENKVPEGTEPRPEENQ